MGGDARREEGFPQDKDTCGKGAQVHDLSCDDSFMAVHISQNTVNIHTLSLCHSRSQCQ